MLVLTLLSTLMFANVPGSQANVHIGPAQLAFASNASGAFELCSLVCAKSF